MNITRLLFNYINDEFDVKVYGIEKYELRGNSGGRKILELKNRFIFAPIKLGYSTDGHVNDRHIAFYKKNRGKNSLCKKKWREHQK